MNVLEVKNLCKRYDGFALENVSFAARKGRILGFIGRNGAGKTTTLKAMMNFVHPDGGEIRFFGLPVAENELAVKQRVGFVSGGIDYYMKKKLRAITHVTRAFYERWDDAAYRRYMEDFKLSENKTPDELSAGMRVKYALALALSHNAELLVLDEPTSGLDPVSRDDLLDVFLSLEEQGVSILFSTHITSDLDKCADDIAYIRNGRILACADIEAFRGAYRLLEIPQETMTDALAAKLVGAKRAKHGYTALVEASRADEIGLGSEPADLESIMIHLEKEENA